jgi:hypothetical protein
MALTLDAGDTAGMLRLARLPLVPLALVAALVQQLGAAPCGCLEHNGWRQGALWLIGHTAHGHPGEPAAGPTFASHDCEDLPADAAIRHTRTGAATEPGPQFFVEAVPYRAGSRGAALAALSTFVRIDGGSAPPLRARLQVYRL